MKKSLCSIDQFFHKISVHMRGSGGLMLQLIRKIALNLSLFRENILIALTKFKIRLCIKNSSVFVDYNYEKISLYHRLVKYLLASDYG